MIDFDGPSSLERSWLNPVQDGNIFSLLNFVI